MMKAIRASREDGSLQHWVMAMTKTEINSLVRACVDMGLTAVDKRTRENVRMVDHDLREGRFISSTVLEHFFANYRLVIGRPVMVAKRGRTGPTQDVPMILGNENGHMWNPAVAQLVSKQERRQQMTIERRKHARELFDEILAGFSEADRSRYEENRVGKVLVTWVEHNRVVSDLERTIQELTAVRQRLERLEQVLGDLAPPVEGI